MWIKLNSDIENFNFYTNNDVTQYSIVFLTSYGGGEEKKITDNSFFTGIFTVVFFTSESPVN